MKSKRELLLGLVGNKNVVITAVDGRCIVRIVPNPQAYGTSIIDEVSEEMIHFVTARNTPHEGWIDIASISEIEIYT